MSAVSADAPLSVEGVQGVRWGERGHLATHQEGDFFTGHIKGLRGVEEFGVETKHLAGETSTVLLLLHRRR